MSQEEAITNRLNELITQGRKLEIGNMHGQIRSSDHASSCRGWIAAAHNLSELIVPNTNPYHRNIQTLVDEAPNRGYSINKCVGEMVAVLEHLKHDAQNGLLASVIRTTQAETLDDLLDAAEDYRKKKHKEGAGILACAVFEDSIRKIGDANTISVNKIDELISQLQKADVVNSILAKRCRVAADVRNKALHAKWNEFELDDVNSVLQLTRKLLSDVLIKN